jgi:hypothetical protein
MDHEHHRPMFACDSAGAIGGNVVNHDRFVRHRQGPSCRFQHRQRLFQHAFFSMLE